MTPIFGVLLWYGVLWLPAFRGRSDFAALAPVIMACIVGLPVSLLGVILGIAAIVRRERLLVLAILGILVNLAALIMSALFWIAVRS
jgi:hypothetical protein